MALQQYDFVGWATRNDIKCSDGRTIRHNAFADNDGKRVPLVWNHNHNDIDNVLGYVILKNADEGVRGYGFFNPTDKGRNAKTILEHGDITSLSIYANKLKQVGGDVIHGDIKEVSLVLAGANPGAYIDEIRHGEDSVLDAIILSTGDEVIIEHGEIDEDKDSEEDENMTVEDVIDSMNEEQKNVLYALVGMASEGEDLSHADDDDDEDEEGFDGDSDGRTIKDVIDSMNEEQKNVLYALVGMAAEDAKDKMEHADDDYDEEYEEEYEEEEGEEPMDDEMTIQDVVDTMNEDQKNVMYALIAAAVEENEEDEDMKHNFFSDDDMYEDELMHGEVLEALEDAKVYGSVKESFLAHNLNPEDVLVHGIQNIDYLYPDYKNVNGDIPFINVNPNGWVSVINNGVHHTPFARIKMMFADITPATARAKGYVKGNQKTEEIFSLLKRTVDPTTIYKKQSFDRDDVVDITDLDAIAWIKKEMRVKLDEERARAYIFGDGRSNSDPDKINESKIIPVVKDTENNLYAMAYEVNPDQDEALAHAVINALVKGMDDYEGSGNVTAFVRSDLVSDMLLMEDKMGQRLYKTINELAAAAAVDKIVKVPASVMPEAVYAVALDLQDYNVGATKGGEVSLFDDFDIDYNKMKYLIETRCSGALTLPHSAIVLKTVGGSL